MTSHGRLARFLFGVIVGVVPFSTRALASDPPPLANALDRVERHGVTVVLRFQRDLVAEAEGLPRAGDREAGREPTGRDEVGGAPEALRMRRMSMRVPGFVVRDRRTVVLSDLFVAPGAVKSVEIEARGGKPVPARLDAFLPRCGAVVAVAASDLDAAPVVFLTGADEASRSPSFVGALAEGESGTESWVELLGVARRRVRRDEPLSYGRPVKSEAGLDGQDVVRTAELVLAEDATPLALRFGSGLLGERTSWRGAELAAELAAAVPMSSLLERKKALAESSAVHQVRIAFRAAGASDTSFDGEASSHAAVAGAVLPEPDDEARWWGISVAPDLLLVPSAMPDAWVERISKVTVEDTGEPVIPATYEGRMRGLGAFVLKLTEATLDPLAASSPPPPPSGEAFLVHRVGWRGGSRRDAVDWNRSLGRSRGYGDVGWLTSEDAVHPGSFLLDLEGRVLGFAAELVGGAGERVALAGPAGRRSAPEVVALLWSDVGGPAAVAKDLERRALPASALKSRRLPWLGVEVEPLRGAAVAEALDVSGPTRDGTRGLLVNVVYPSSPASRTGIHADDILLSARKTADAAGDALPVDLKDVAGSTEWLDDSDVPRPWVPRRNALVRLLDGWGEGTAYELEWLHAGVVRRASLVVEVGPPDVTTAEARADDVAGLTVKELTYEVRHALHLAADAPGVLVSRVEEGSVAFQARLLANEVIVEVDGRPVTGPASFSSMLAAARAGGKRDVRVAVLRLDRSRFVDLRVSAGEAPPAPAPR